MDNRDEVVVGINRMPNKVAPVALHACSLADESLQPHASTGILFLHSAAVQDVAQRSVAMGVAERYAKMGEVLTSTRRPPPRRRRSRRSQAAVLCRPRDDAPPHLHPRRRDALVRVDPDDGPRLGVDAPVGGEPARRGRGPGGDERGVRFARLGVSPLCVLSTSQDDQSRTEPVCAPTSRLGVGLRLNELLRRYMIGRTRKNGISVVVCGLRAEKASDDIPKDLGSIMDTEPLPMAIVSACPSTASGSTFATRRRRWARRSPCASTRPRASPGSSGAWTTSSNGGR